jgi:tRNA 2-thiouridine synthesizing protein B
MLHIVKTQSAIQSALSCVQSGDVLLLIEEAVYLANGRHHLHEALANQDVFVLLPDVVARGIMSSISTTINPIDYIGFVSLTEQHEQSLSWE